MYQCPKCRETDSNLRITAAISTQIDIDCEGEVQDSEQGDLYWSGTDRAECMDCQRDGTVAEMTIDEEEDEDGGAEAQPAAPLESFPNVGQALGYACDMLADTMEDEVDRIATNEHGDFSPADLDIAKARARDMQTIRPLIISAGKLDAFVRQIARMQTDEEFEEGNAPPAEDWLCTLSELIVKARKLTRKEA